MPELAAIELGALINEGAGRLRHSGLAEPRRQAVRIWTELTDSGPADAYLFRGTPVDGSAADRFLRAIDRRGSGEPLPYVTGWCGFRRLSLHCDRRALIPRPETEGLIDLILQRAGTGRVADVGTGSGCIALSLAIEGHFSEVLGIDSSYEALNLARLNRDVVAASSVTFIQSDLCCAMRPGSLDALVSNPPYLTAAEYSSLDESVRDWEPAMALVSGEDGLEATARLLDQGHRAVRPGGWIALEIDCTRAASVGRLASQLGWSDVSVHVDLFGRERYLLARRSDTR